jgi:hypothetical protein
MLIKILLKIWPAITPILLYIFWNYVIDRILKKIFKRKDTIKGDKIVKDGEKIIGESASEKLQENFKNEQKISPFSLRNRYFVIILYISFISAIFTLIYGAFN